MPKVLFKHPDQAYIYQKLLDAVNQVCMDFKKDCICVAGYRSLECQKVTNAGVLATRKGAYQLPNGAVYTGTGPNRICWASAYGQSGHCFCICMDIEDTWFKALTNEQLAKYGIVKSVPHENWHVTLIELVGINDSKKIAIRDSVLNKGAIPKMEMTFEQALKIVTTKANTSYDFWIKKRDIDPSFPALIIKIGKVLEGVK